jgi:glycosyltransferase involved in cell wall biosynthesis
MSARVSIVIPCCNAERWLAATLDSALAQTAAGIEIVVVDDGSTDGSRAVAARHADRGVRLIAQPNRGASAARNAGLAATSGRWVQFLDADDLLAPDKIARQLALLSTRPDLRLVAGAWARFAADPAAADFRPLPVGRELSGVEFLQLHYETGAMMHPAAWLAERALLDETGPWNESLSLNDDGEYFARVMLAAPRFGFAAEARSYYRTGHTRSLSGRKDPAALDSLYRSVDLTVTALLAADGSARTRAAATHAWKVTAFEVYPERPDLADAAERRSRALGGSTRPLPAGRALRLAARLIGWRRAKRWLQTRG